MEKWIPRLILPEENPNKHVKYDEEEEKKKLCQYAIVVVVEIQNRRNDKHKLDEI